MTHPDLPVWLGLLDSTQPMALLPAAAALALLARIGAQGAVTELRRIVERGVGSFEWPTPAGRLLVEAA